MKPPEHRPEAAAFRGPTASFDTSREPRDPLSLFDRFADAGAADPEASEWLQGVLRRHRQARGEISLEAAAGLPFTPAGWRLARSAQALRLAASLLDSGGERRIVELSGRLNVFATRGAFRRWIRAGGPPADSTELERALFAALEWRDGEPPSESTVRRALRHFSARSDGGSSAGCAP